MCKPKIDYSFENFTNKLDKSILLIGEYPTSRFSEEKVLLKHTCGLEFKSKIRFVLLTSDGKCCPDCHLPNAKRSNLWWLRQIKELGNGEYTALSNYAGNAIKASVRHDKCGYEFEIRPNDWMNGHHCKHCSAGIYSTELFAKHIHDKYNNKYDIITPYNVNKKEQKKQKITIKHNQCNHEFEVRADRLLNDDVQCPMCENLAGYRNLNDFNFTKELLHRTVNEEYTLLSVINGKHSKNVRNRNYMRIRHETCGFEYDIYSPDFFNRNIRCSKCNHTVTRYNRNSRMVNEIYNILTKFGIKFKTEARIIKNPKTNRFLPLDIYSEECNFAIEFDGSQHYDLCTNLDNVTQQSGGMYNIIARDRMKEVMLWKQNISLLRIDYTYNLSELDEVERIIGKFIVECSKNINSPIIQRKSRKLKQVRGDYRRLRREQSSALIDLIEWNIVPIKKRKNRQVGDRLPKEYSIKRISARTLNTEFKFDDTIGYSATKTESNVDFKDKVTFIHETCGHTFTLKYNSVNSKGFKCPKCKTTSNAYGQSIGARMSDVDKFISDQLKQAA